MGQWEEDQLNKTAPCATKQEPHGGHDFLHLLTRKGPLHLQDRLVLRRARVGGAGGCTNHPCPPP